MLLSALVAHDEDFRALATGEPNCFQRLLLSLYELLHPLVRQPQELAGVSETHSLVHQRFGGGPSLLLGVLALPLCALACTTTALNGGPEIGWEADLFLDRSLLRPVDPEPERLAKSAPRLLQRAPIRMTPTD